MERINIMWILESCLLSLDGYTKKQIIEFDCPEKLADAGIKIYDYLIQKELNVYND